MTKWNDPAIASNNPGLNLPDMPITVVYRSDGSGTTFVFSKHLCAINSYFKDLIGMEDMQVTWPVGISGRGNDGVTALIKHTPGSIGYIEYGYAIQSSLPMAELQNKRGNFVAPTLASGTATLSRIEMPSNLRAWASDPTGPDDYPIVTFTWILVNKNYPDKAKWKGTARCPAVRTD